MIVTTKVTDTSGDNITHTVFDAWIVPFKGLPGEGAGYSPRRCQTVRIFEWI